MLPIIRRHPSASIVLLAVIILLVSLAAWWQFVWQNPGRVFAGMLRNNLTTSSVTRFGQASGQGQSIEQHVRLQLGSTNASNWLVSVSQADASAVTTESIGLPDGSGYVRYARINTKQKRSDGKPFDFSSAVNVWGKSEKGAASSMSQLFSQSLLDIGTAPMPPIANLSPANRQAILDFIDNQRVFEPSYKNVKHETVAGKKVYTYQVKVQLGPYVRMMQAFAHDLGVTTLDVVDASQFQTTKPVTLAFSVDPVSHQLVRVSYSEANFSETYSDWGLTTPITVPKHAIPVTDLQARLQAIEK